MGRGISRIFDVIVACTIFLVGSSAMIAAVPVYTVSHSFDLSTLASHTLSYLDREHVLGYLVYSRDSDVAISTFGCLLPPHLGFRFEVYDTNWALLWSAESRLGYDSGSASYYLAGFNGSFLPLIVVLQISR